MVAVRKVEEEKKIQLKNFINRVTVYIAHFHLPILLGPALSSKTDMGQVLKDFYMCMNSYHIQRNPVRQVGSISKPALPVRTSRQSTSSDLSKVI